jgi:hypothetical protein
MTAPIIPEGWRAAAEAIAPYAAQPKAGWILIPLAITVRHCGAALLTR